MMIFGLQIKLKMERATISLGIRKEFPTLIEKLTILLAGAACVSGEKRH